MRQWRSLLRNSLPLRLNSTVTFGCRGCLRITTLRILLRLVIYSFLVNSPLNMFQTKRAVWSVPCCIKYQLGETADELGQFHVSKKHVLKSWKSLSFETLYYSRDKQIVKFKRLHFCFSGRERWDSLCCNFQTWSTMRPGTIFKQCLVYVEHRVNYVLF